MSKATLGELMGARGASVEARKLTIKDLPEILGEKMPKLQYSPVGRMHLVDAFRVRFGENYTRVPGVKDILKEFDEELRFNVKRQEMKMIKAKGKKNAVSV